MAAGGRGYEQLLGEAVAVLTEAARLTRPAGGADGVAGSRREPVDWAEFVASAVAGAAANVGGIEAVLAGRPGSWEADFVRRLLVGTVGEDEQYLLEHRTEPVVVDLRVNVILTDLGAWDAYDAAYIDLDQRAGAVAASDASDEEKTRLVDGFGELQERLDRLQQDDWASYGQALKANVEAAAARRYPDLPVPLVVTVDLTPGYPADAAGVDIWGWGIVDRLRGEAIEATPLPGGGQLPLRRLGTAGGVS
jgi:hypothetical protein